ncbi:hypothetical protein [Streptomyces ficellus]|uniref:hypothetical protein n=1 Tax=Streptomyces ficellus TaxID=1977088 RepID=UPI001FCB4172|nr:hypothetical protein [Streptomyces ficellus]
MTPEQQAKDFTDKQQAQHNGIVNEFVATDVFERTSSLLDGFFRGGKAGDSLYGRTDFEDAQLNAMLDLLDSAKPADLEAASVVLKNATKALNQAAKDLASAVAAPDWKGEGAESFRSYGAGIADYAYKLATFANVAGTQMEVASIGLTSVRNSKPPRDGRAEKKPPEAFTAAERRQDNQEYQQALEAERNRQEAINQMNRLASFYAVSNTNLAAQESPPVPKPLSAAVPAPLGRVDERTAGTGPTSAEGARAAFTGPDTDRGEGGTDDGAPRVELTDKPRGVVGPNTSVQIDSVLTPPAPTPAPAPVTQPPQTGPTGPVTGNPPPMPTNFGPVRPAPSRAQGTPAVPRGGGGQGKPTLGRSPVTGTGGPGQTGRTGPAVGRATPTNGPTSSTGRSAGPTVGRPGMPGAQQATGRPATGGGNPVTGRPGMPGQTAPGRQGGTGTPRAGHSNGIVGGTPQRATNGSTTGPRIPRATVIGAEGATTGRTGAARPSQSGVIGAQGNSPVRPAGRGTPSANGIVGTPRGAAAGPGGGGRPGQRQSRDDEQERTGSSRPEYLIEDEQTWASRRRGAVPPVID